MWFKQCTCDNCFNLLDEISIYNSYVIFNLIDRKVLDCDDPFNSYLQYSNEYIFNFADFSYANTTKKGKLYIYKPKPKYNNTFFCSNKCAFEFISNNNSLSLYYDKSLDSVRAITQDMKTINNKLGGSEYRGLYISWTRAWLINFTKVDLTKYNLNDKFPIIKSNNLILREFITEESEDLLSIFSENDFINLYDGYENKEKYYSELSDESTKKHIDTWNLFYKRRFAIQWAIQSKESYKIIGFIKIHRLHEIDKESWYVEFAIKSNYRGNGYAKEALNTILKWCKINGLNEIKAMVETYNFPCLKIMDGFAKNKFLTEDNNYLGEIRKIWAYVIKL
jgi:RimJ/RimL family protein N-acetyltransferase